MRGVSANIMLGNQARIGTGLFDLMLNMNALQQAVPQDEAIAPGKEVNIYHGMASVQEVSSIPYAMFKGTDATPMVNEASLFMRDAISGSSVAPFANSMLYGPGAQAASAIHYSQVYPMPLQHQQQQKTGSVGYPVKGVTTSSAPYDGIHSTSASSFSAMSSASVYYPVLSNELGSTALL